MILKTTRTAGFKSSISQHVPGGMKTQKLSFKESIPENPFKAMAQLRIRLSTQQSISPQELLLYQVRAGELGMNVELVSKVGESVSASLKKLQQQG